jgi:hypothetical protein
MHDHHPAESISGLGFWDLIVAHIKSIPVRDATVEDLLGCHSVFVCTGPQCGFGAATKNGVKRHLHIHKGGCATEIHADLRSEIVVGCKGDCSDEREKPANDEDDPEHWEQENSAMNVAQRNVIGKYWTEKSKKLTTQGISMRHPTRVEAKPIQD